MKDNMIFQIAKLTLKPGDVLVFRTEWRLKEEAAHRLTETFLAFLKEAGHPDTKVLVLGPGATLEILEHAA